MRFIIAALALCFAMPAAAEPGLWRVSNGDTEIFLFGTIHELPASAVWLTPRIASRVDAANSLVLETVIPEDRGVIGQLVTRLGFSPKLPRLETRVAPSKRLKVMPIVREVGLPIASLDGMETWYAALTLGDAALEKLGFNTANGVEPVLTARVHASGKPIVGLETPAQQLGYFDTLPETDQRALLDATLDDVATAKVDSARLVAAWLAGDTNALAADFDRSMRATPRLVDVLVKQRNARWADWIALRLKSPGKVFLAVGAAHLAGPDSVQTLLTAKGITVERLP